LQQIVDKDAQAQSLAINAFAIEHRKKADAEWVASGGEMIKLSPDEQSTLMKILKSVGQDVSKTKPALAAAYEVVTDAAQRLR
jgi:hypothetical protein